LKSKATRYLVSIANVRFSTRITNALNVGGVKTVGEIRGASDATLLSLQDLGKESLTYLRKTLGLPSTEGVQPGSAKPPEREAELKAKGK
jgi:DNA-directed RNA polymerase alpha subunit